MAQVKVLMSSRNIRHEGSNFSSDELLAQLIQLGFEFPSTPNVDGCVRATLPDGWSVIDDAEKPRYKKVLDRKGRHRLTLEHDSYTADSIIEIYAVAVVQPLLGSVVS